MTPWLSCEEPDHCDWTCQLMGYNYYLMYMMCTNCTTKHTCKYNMINENANAVLSLCTYYQS